MAKLNEPVKGRIVTKKQAERLLRLNQKVKGKGDTFCGYAHAINNPLGLQQEPNLISTFYVERVNLISSLQRKVIRKKNR